jgi:glycosyltransferase involved in cell wall biosynthesis
MKVLFDHLQPFFFAHGGFQTQIEQTRQGLLELGVEVEWLRWWDDTQKGDLIHYFGTAPASYLRQARSIGIPTVMTTLFTATCNRSDRLLRLQGTVVRTVLGLPVGGGIKRQLEWSSFGLCDRNVVGLEAERRVLELVYGLPASRVSLLPLGLPDRFLSAQPSDRAGDHLICVGTITERKCSVELADLARRAEVPILFVGKPYAESDPYWKTFSSKIDNHWVRYQPHVHSEDEMIALLRNARGCVVKSWYENWCLAAHEAAACGLPLLVPDQKWSRERFGAEATYFSTDGTGDAEILRRFYQHCPDQSQPKIQLHSWRDVATLLRPIYESVANQSPPLRRDGVS